MRKKSIAIVLMLAVFITFMPVCMSYAAGSAPGKVKVTSVKAKKASAKTGKAKVTVKWKKQKGASGYEVFVKRVDGKWKLAKTVSGHSGSAKIKAFVGKNSVRVRALSKTADGTAYGKYSKAKKFLLDHHPFPGANYSVTLSHPEASSTSELVFHLICALGDFNMIDKEMAQCIYTGIMTDTGALSYNSNNSNLFQVVAHLLDKGIDKDEIYRLVYNNYSESRLRLQGFVLNDKMQVFPERSTAVITLTDKELKRFKYKKGDTEGFVNMPLQIDGILLSAFFREDKEQGLIKLSFRSTGTVPCNRFSSEFYNGGGHLNAAGGEFKGTLEEAVEVFNKGLEEWSHSDEDCIRQLFKK